MIAIRGVTPEELGALLAEAEREGASAHVTVNRVDAFSGVILAHPQIGFIGIDVRAAYALKDDTLAVACNRGEGLIEQKLELALAEIRRKSKP